MKKNKPSAGRPITQWPVEKRQLLRKLYSKHSQKELAQIFKVSLGAIKGKAIALNLKKRDRGWTKKEETHLLKNWDISSKMEIAQNLGKCRSAVIRKYNSLMGI